MDVSEREIVTDDGRRLVKVWLPGESPWGEVLAENPDGSFVVRIDNMVAGDYSAREFSDLLAGMFGAEPDYSRDLRHHAFRFNDVVRACPEDGVLKVIGLHKH